MIKRLLEADKKLVLKFALSLFLTVFLTIMFFSLQAYAANNSQSTESADSQSVSETAELLEYLDNDPENVGDSPTASILQQVIGVDASQPLEIIILLTIIALLPSLLIMMTCFTRIVIVLSFLRTAMQTQNTPPNMVITGMALFLTLFIMAPVFSEMNEIAYQPYVNEELTTEEALNAASVPLKRFMVKQTSNDDIMFFVGL